MLSIYLLFILLYAWMCLVSCIFNGLELFLRVVNSTGAAEFVRRKHFTNACSRKFEGFVGTWFAVSWGKIYMEASF